MKYKNIFPLLLLVSILSFGACSFTPNSDESSDPLDSSAVSNNDMPSELVRLVKDKIGEYLINVQDGYLELSTVAEGNTLLGTSDLTKLTVDGGEEKSVLETTGAGVGCIMLASGGTLVLKNLKIQDSSPKGTYDGKGDSYLAFGGKLRFENCQITDSIYLKSDAEAEFINCTFDAPDASRYGVWMADGSASFNGCTFTGMRALKIHEKDGEDVVNVTIENCEFVEIIEKPGIAIGTVDADTEVAVKYCEFLWCAEWDHNGSLEGVQSVYESDTATESFLFTLTGNTVNGVSL